MLKGQSLSHVRPFATPSTTAHQAPLSMGFSRQEYWSELPFPSPEDLPSFPTLQEDSLWTGPPRKPLRWGGALINPKDMHNFR